MGVLFGIVAVIQFLLHYLGWGVALLGVVALVFGNVPRGVELLGSGVGFLFLKYLIGFVFLTIVGWLSKEKKTETGASAEAV